MPDINVVQVVVVLVSILISMTLHEAMHGFVAYWLGDDTAKLEGRLTLNPLAHIDLFTTVLLPLGLFILGAPPFGAAKPVPFNPARLRHDEYGAALVGAAGPLTNFALAAVAALVLRFIGSQMSSGAVDTVLIFLLVNISFCIFNLIPFPPLDGSRVLYAFAPDAVRDLMERIEAMGFTAIIFFMFVFYMFLSQPFGHLIQVVVEFLVGQPVF